MIKAEANKKLDGLIIKGENLDKNLKKTVEKYEEKEQANTAS